MKLTQISALFAAVLISTGAAACGCKGGKPSRPPAPSPAPTAAPAPSPTPSPAPSPAPATPSGSSTTYTGSTSSLPPGHPLTWPDPVPPAPAPPASAPQPEVIFVPVVVEVPAEPVIIVISTAYAVPGPERIVYVERALCDAVRPPPKPAIQVTKRKPAPKACK